MLFVGSSRPSLYTSPSFTENLSVGFLSLWLLDEFGQGDTAFRRLEEREWGQAMHRSASRPAVISGCLCPLTRAHCSFPGGQPYLTASCSVLVIAHSFQPMVGSRAAFIALGYSSLTWVTVVSLTHACIWKLFLCNKLSWNYPFCRLPSASYWDIDWYEWLFTSSFTDDFDRYFTF